MRPVYSVRHPPGLYPFVWALPLPQSLCNQRVSEISQQIQQNQWIAGKYPGISRLEAEIAKFAREYGRDSLEIVKEPAGERDRWDLGCFEAKRGGERGQEKRAAGRRRSEEKIPIMERSYLGAKWKW